MTDEQKRAIEEDMPRFASLADANAYMKNNDPALIVPKWIQRGNALILNPAWTHAPYVYGLIWGPSTPV